MWCATRRTLLLSAGFGAVALLGPESSARAADSSVDPAKFIAFAYSSAELQNRASALAASKDTRPEVQDFARAMVAFSAQQKARLQAFAQERGLKLPGEQEFEHKVVLENLEPLDHLALTRRYAEVEVQALEQQIRGYEAASQGSDTDLKQFAAEQLPELRQHLAAARRMHDAVKP